jgi:hypothetical protein
MVAAPRAVERTLALIYDPFQPHATCVLEDNRPLGFRVLVEPYSAPYTHEQARELCFALFQRLCPEVVTI